MVYNKSEMSWLLFVFCYKRNCRRYDCNYIIQKVRTPGNHTDITSKMTIQKRIVIFNFSKNPLLYCDFLEHSIDAVVSNYVDFLIITHLFKFVILTKIIIILFQSDCQLKGHWSAIFLTSSLINTSFDLDKSIHVEVVDCIVLDY